MRIVPFKRLICSFSWMMSVLLFLLLFAADCYAQALSYDIKAEFNYGSHTIKAAEEVVFINDTDKGLKEVYFHIYPNRKYSIKEIDFIYKYSGYFKMNPYPQGFDAGDFNIRNISINGDNAGFVIEGDDQTILRVKLPQILLPGKKLKINFNFSLRVPHAYGRLGWHDNITMLNRWYPIVSYLDNDIWCNYPFYVYHQPFVQDAANYNVELTLREDLVVVNSADKEKSITSGNKKTLIMQTTKPIRDFSLAISPDYSMINKKINNICIKSYYLNGQEKKAREALENAISLFSYYSKNVGSYPYKSFSIAPVFLGYGGHESSNMIFIDTRAYKMPNFLKRHFDFLISHETGHQWFYNLIGSDEFKETFLDEALNSFFLLKYLEDKYDDGAKVLELSDSLRKIVPNFSFQQAGRFRYLFAAKNGLDRPVLGKLSSFQEPSSIFTIAYGKGTQVLKVLESIIGPDKFNAAIRTYFDKFKFKVAGINDFIDILDKETSYNLKELAEKLLTNTYTCDYSLERIGNKIYLKNKGTIDLPIVVNIINKNKTKKTFTLDNNEKIVLLPIEDLKQIECIYLSESILSLDIDRTNNFLPRKIKIKIVPLYYFVYDIPVFLDDSAINVTVGPAIGTNSLGVKISLQEMLDYKIEVGSLFDFSEELFVNNLGINLFHLQDRQVSFGANFSKQKDFSDDLVKDDLESIKVFLRKELRPVSYGLFEPNEHLSVYLLRESRPKDFLVNKSIDNLGNKNYYLTDESMVGIDFCINQASTYPDYTRGWQAFFNIEQAGHFLNGRNDFTRSLIKINRFFPVFHKDSLGVFFKLGLGMPNDKYLFFAAGAKGLRGYDRKEIKGSNMFVTRLEYKTGIVDDLGLYLWDNLLHLKKVSVIPFFDVGKAWFGSFKDADFKKDAGIGIALDVDIAGFLEASSFRFDFAQAIDESKQDSRIWFSLNQSF